MKNILLVISIIFHTVIQCEVEVWDCNGFKGVKIVSPMRISRTLNCPWESDSIYNEYSEYSSEWGPAVFIILNILIMAATILMHLYSMKDASDPPKIINEDNEEIGLLSGNRDWDDGGGNILRILNIPVTGISS